MEAAQTSFGSVAHMAIVHSAATDSDTDLALERELAEHWLEEVDWRNSFVAAVAAVGYVAEVVQRSHVVHMVAHQMSGLGLKLLLRRADSQLRPQAGVSSLYA